MTNPYSDPKTAEILYDYFQGYVNSFNQGSYRDGFEDGINLVLSQLNKLNPETNPVTFSEVKKYLEAEGWDNAIQIDAIVRFNPLPENIDILCMVNVCYDGIGSIDLKYPQTTIEKICWQKDLTPLALYFLIKTKYAQ